MLKTTMAVAATQPDALALPSATSQEAHTLSQVQEVRAQPGPGKMPHLPGASIEDGIDKGHDSCLQVHFIPVPAQASVQFVQQGLDGKAARERRGELRILEVQPLCLFSCHPNRQNAPSILSPQLSNLSGAFATASRSILCLSMSRSQPCLTSSPPGLRAG